MKKLLSILTLLLCICSGAWANQTTLIEGVILPDQPSSALDMSSQEFKTPDANGWIVFNPNSDVRNASPALGWFAALAWNTASCTLSDVTSYTAPFATMSSTNVTTVRKTERTKAMKFTGAETLSVLGQAANNNRKLAVALFKISGSDQVEVETKYSDTGTSYDELLFDGLNTSTVYVVYFYAELVSGNDGNTNLCQIALKKSTGKAASSFALTSEESVTLWKGETSDITTSGNAGTVTYSNGGDDDVATVDSNGKITAVGEGTATITVTDPGDEDTDGRILYVSVTVNEHKNTTTTNEPAAYDDVFVVSGNVASDKNSATNGDFTVKDYVGTAGNGLQTSTTDLTIGGNSYKAIKLASSRRFTVEALEGVTITSVKAYLTSQNSSTVAFSQRYNSDNTRSDVDAGDEETIPASGSAPIEIDLTKYYQYGFRFEGGTYAVFKITYTAPKHMAVTIKETGYATLFTDYAVAIPEDVKAYWGKLNDAKDEVQLTEITGTIPASTAVILKTETPGTYNFVAAEDVAAIENNILEGTLTDKVVAANSVYTLGLGTDGTVGMRQYSGTSVRAYSAYMEAPAGDARFYSLGFGDDDETTGVNNLSVVKVDISVPMYNLAGQRVRNDYKGIVVQKGKKFLNK